MKENVNTNQFEMLEQGKYTFCVENVERIDKGTYVFYKFTLSYVKDGQRKVWTTILFRSNMGDILRFTGMQETSHGQFELDYDLIKGKLFSGMVIHEADKKGIVREKIIDVNPVDQTSNPDGIKDPAEIKWDE